MTIEAESEIEIDEEKLARFLEDHGIDRGASIKSLQTRLERLITGEGTDDPFTRDQLAAAVATENGYDKFAGMDCTIDIEEFCSVHQWWFPLEPTKQAQCWMCKNDQRAGSILRPGR